MQTIHSSQRSSPTIAAPRVQTTPRYSQFSVREVLWTQAAIQRALERLLGPHATFKSEIQRDALRLITSSHPESLIVITTGASKSLLFILPTILPGAQVTIVIRHSLPYSRISYNAACSGRVTLASSSHATHCCRPQPNRLFSSSMPSAHLAQRSSTLSRSCMQPGVLIASCWTRRTFS